MKPSRIAKRLIAPALLAATLVVVQVVLAAPPQPSFSVVGPNFTTTCGLYTFTSTSTDPDDDIATIAWNIAGHCRERQLGHRDLRDPRRPHDQHDGDRRRGRRRHDRGLGYRAQQPVTVVNEGAPNAACLGRPNHRPAEPDRHLQRRGLDRLRAAARSPSTNGTWTATARYETDTGTTASDNAAPSPTTGFHTVGLRVTDNCGAQDFASAAASSSTTRRQRHRSRSRQTRPASGRPSPSTAPPRATRAVRSQLRVGLRGRRRLRRRRRRRPQPPISTPPPASTRRSSRVTDNDGAYAHDVPAAEGQRQADRELLVPPGHTADQRAGRRSTGLRRATRTALSPATSGTWTATAPTRPPGRRRRTPTRGRGHRDRKAAGDRQRHHA